MGSQNVLNKFNMALAIVTSIMMAMADSRLDVGEVVVIINSILQAMGIDAIPAKSVKIKVTPAGALSIMIDKSIVEKLRINV